MIVRSVTFALIFASALAAQRGSANRMVIQRREPITADAISKPDQPDFHPGAIGPGIVRAQILLARAHFSCGEIDGDFGTNLQKALAAFQQERQIPASGVLDQPTWTALNADAAPLLMPYSITPDDQKGPFAPVPADLMEQAKLPALSYTSLVEELAERFHISPQVLQALNPHANLNATDQSITVPNVLGLPPGVAAKVVVSKAESSVRAYDGQGKLLAFYSATIGSDHDPLPIGEWKIRGVSRNPQFHYDSQLFWDAKGPDDKAVIQPGPNNPVGLVWIDLSKDHYGIHGTPDPSRIGHTTSHGCIRLTNWDAVELASMVKPGLAAVLQE